MLAGACVSIACGVVFSDWMADAGLSDSCAHPGAVASKADAMAAAMLRIVRRIQYS